MATTSVAGVDRWRKGWVVALAGEDGLDVSAHASIDDVLGITRGCAAVAIDMPIALVEKGRRDAEAVLRARLGAAARSVFTSPTRAALDACDRARADEVNRHHGGPGVSAQAWGLAASIREVRTALLGTAAATAWFEAHPEGIFATMSGGRPLTGKRTARGVAARLDLLRRWYADLDRVLLQSPEGVPIDDVLDAIACAWTARRIVDGSAELLGPAGRDDEGFPLGIRL